MSDDYIDEDPFDYSQPPVGADETLNLELAVKAAEYAAYWQERIREVADHYDAEHQKLMAKLDALEERRQHEIGKLTRKYAWHEARIRHYHEQVLEADPKRKTLDLIHGSSRAVVPAKVQVFVGPDGSEGVTEWARRAHPELCKAPGISEIRNVVTVEDGKVVDRATHEVVPGLIAQVPAPRYSFEADPWSPL